MKTSIILTSLLTLAFSFGFTPGNDTKINSFVGHAYDLTSNKAIYNEFHEEQWVAGKLSTSSTQYKGIKGNVLGSRKLNFSTGYELPTYRLDVTKNGYYEGAQILKGSIKVYHYDVETKKEHSKTLVVPAPAVVDAGIGYFIKRNWTNIAAGKIVSFNFVVPARLDYYKFRVRKVKNVDEQGHKGILICLEPDGFLLRSVIDPINITYDIATKRIIKYEGISNIPGSGDRNFDARLVYPELGN